MKSKLGSLFATAIGLILLGYSAYRSYDFVALTLPGDKQIIAYFALAALDGGILAWLASYLYGSKGPWQRAISLIMVGIDFLGAVVMFSADTLLNAGKAGLVTEMSPGMIQTLVFLLSLVIALNIGATIGHHLTEPDMLRRQAEEEARDQIEAEALKLINTNAKALAAQVAPQVANAWRESMVTEYGHRLKKARGDVFKELPVLLPPDTEQVEPDPTNPPSKRRRE